MEELTNKDFDQVFQLMQLSFIADELRPYEEQKALLQEPVYHIYGERDSSTQALKGFIAIWDFANFVFVDYFAVHPAYRSQGLGKVILDQLRKRTDKEICLEIELPIDEITYRRLKFYQRNQFILCDYPYVQPPIARGNAPVALALMSSHKINSAEHFQLLRTTIYKYAYERFN